MDKNVTESYDLWPRYLRVAGFQFLGDSCSRLAYYRELLYYGAAEQLRGLKCWEISVREELSKVVRSFNDIGEIQAVMPHTKAAILPRRKLGSVVSVRSSKPDPLSARGGATAPTSVRHNPPDRSPRPAGTQQA